MTKKTSQINQQFTRLSDRAVSSLYLLTKEGILLYLHLLKKGGPYLGERESLRASFANYEIPLKELENRGLVLSINEEQLINPFYYIDTESPSRDYRYNPFPIELAAKLFVARDLRCVADNSFDRPNAQVFQDEIWEKKECRYFDYQKIRKEWGAIFNDLEGEGRYREESRLDKTKLDKTRGDKTRQEAKAQRNAPFSSCACPDDGLTEDDLPF